MKITNIARDKPFLSSIFLLQIIKSSQANEKHKLQKKRKIFPVNLRITQDSYLSY